MPPSLIPLGACADPDITVGLLFPSSFWLRTASGSARRHTSGGAFCESSGRLSLGGGPLHRVLEIVQSNCDLRAFARPASRLKQFRVATNLDVQRHFRSGDRRGEVSQARVRNPSAGPDRERTSKPVDARRACRSSFPWLGCDERIPRHFDPLTSTEGKPSCLEIFGATHVAFPCRRSSRGRP